MKRSFKIIALILVFTMLLPSFPAFAEGESTERVEIVFCVGDKVLSINGKDVEVETPYVVGAGVTLVPARVITEAFGATVGWEHETKTVTIEYPGVNIVLQIDNPIAEVNGKAETLLSPPELTSNGFTMIPLRFISETFGATVGYDEVTKKITVVKEKDASGNIVEGGIDAERIGDSYYNWSMDYPDGMEMTERSFDATVTTFSYDQNNGIDLGIWLIEDDFDFNRDFAEWKTSLSGYTLVKADKDVSKKYMHFQAKDKTYFLDIWQYVVGHYVYILYGKFENANTNVKDEGIRAMSTFAISYGEGAYDLSNVKGGMRTFRAEDLNLSIDIPEDFYLYSDEEAINEFLFRRMNPDDDISQIAVEVYSKSSVTSAKALAEKDYTGNKRQFNEKLSVFSKGVEEKNEIGVTTYEYTMEVNLSAGKRYTRDVFFEKGDYVYNVAVTLLGNKEADEIIDRVIKSIIAMEIDQNKVGILMRNDPEKEGTFVSKGSNFSVTVPNAYLEQESDSGKAFLSMYSGATVILQVSYAGNATYSDVSRAMKDMEGQILQEKGVVVTKSASPVTIGGIKYSEIHYTQTIDGSKAYMRVLMGLSEGKLVMWMLGFEELTYSSYNIGEVEGIIKSLVLN